MQRLQLPIFVIVVALLLYFGNFWPQDPDKGQSTSANSANEDLSKSKESDSRNLRSSFADDNNSFLGQTNEAVKPGKLILDSDLKLLAQQATLHTDQKPLVDVANGSSPRYPRHPLPNKISAKQNGRIGFTLNDEPGFLNPVRQVSHQDVVEQKAGSTIKRFSFLEPTKEDIIPLLDLRKIPLDEAMRSFAESTGINVLISSTAAKKEVSAYLRNVGPMAAIDAITRANGLYYVVDEKTGIVRISTVEEYEANLTSFREEQTKVFTLLYPNPLSVAFAIKNLFGDQVQLNSSDSDNTDFADLIQRLGRFDLLDSRRSGLGSFQSNSNSGFGGNQNGLNSSGPLSRFGGLGGGNNQLGIFGNSSGLNNDSFGLPRRNQDGHRQNDPPQLTPAQIIALEKAKQSGNDPAEILSQILRKRKATIFVTVIRKNNQLIVRTGDEKTMAQIKKLIRDLDVPTPLVLLEVKVLRVELGDGFNSVFDFQQTDGDTNAGAFTLGSILPIPNQNVSNIALAASAFTGASAGDLTFQFVNEGFRAKMQLMENLNRVTTLSTPLLLTANNEVSRIFVGETIPFTTGFSPAQVIPSATAPVSIGATPITENRDVGQSMLITPNINADRTVTLRIVQENSRRVINGATIPIASSDGRTVTNQNVDTISRSNVSGTIVAKDGLAVVLGGLIEEQVNDTEERVPGLGRIPGLGFFFKRQTKGVTRSELLIMIRPYVFNTPTESAAMSRELLDILSVHPNSPVAEGTLNTYSPEDAIQVRPEFEKGQKTFRFHTR